MKVDVIVCTKNKHTTLPKCVEQIREFIPYNKIIIVDSSENPNLNILNKLGALLIFTPNAKLGYARQKGLDASTTDRVFYIDDDIILDKCAFGEMMKLFEEPNVIGVSGRVIYGWKSNKVLFKLYSRGRPIKHGGSGGLVILDRKEVLNLGGYNKNIHWGEDAELCHRIEQHGLVWTRALKAKGYHPCTFTQFLQRGKRNGEGYKVLWLFGKKLLPILVQLSGRTFFMPVYYTIQIRDPRILVYYFLYNMLFLCGFLLEMKRK